MNAESKIVGINYHDDGTATVEFSNYRVERYSDKDQIAAISNTLKRQREERASPRFPDLLA